MAASPRPSLQKKPSTKIFKELYKAPTVFKTKDYAPMKHQFTVARKELAAYAFLCRQAEAREWLEFILGEKFEDNPDPGTNAEAIMKRTYKSDLFPPLRSGERLCKMINLIKPGSVAKVVSAQGKPFLMLENINFFLEAARQLGIPEHKLFLPLDLLERKNMPKVVYCLHEMAAFAYSKFGIGRAIVDRTGTYHFDDDELQKAQRDLEEIETNQSGTSDAPVRTHDQMEQDRRAREAELKALEAERAAHNAEQIKNATRTIVLNQLVPTDLVIEGKSKAENVNGDRDGNYAIYADITYTDGSKAPTQHISFSTGTHDWEQQILPFHPEKPIKEVNLYPRFQDHSGKVWFDKFGCFEDRPPVEYIQFVQNPSFEKADSGSEKLAAFWKPAGAGYQRDGEHHVATGEWGIQVTGGEAVSHVIIYQNEPAPVIIEGFSMATNVDGVQDENYSLHGDVTFSDGSKEKFSVQFSVGSHEWEKQSLLFDPKDKAIKEMELSAKFQGHAGEAFFDVVTVCQEESKQYVKNPSFEQVEGDGARNWEAVGAGYQRDHNEWNSYGHTSVRVESESESEEHGVKQLVVLNQKKPNTVQLGAHSKCEDVTGDKGDTYALVADVTFQDGSTQRQVVPFRPGTHDWEVLSQEFDPKDKPIKTILLQAVFKNRTGRAWFDNLTVTEDYTFGETELFMLQRILRSLHEDKDWIDEITELKRQMLKEVRKNHALEKELQSIEKRIALLIKNRVDVQEVLQASKRFLRIFKWKEKKTTAQSGTTISFITKRLQQYEELFYLLQTQPKYLAKIVTLITGSQMESFLDTVILTLFGDTYNPREEFLLLQLLKQAIINEMVTYKDVSGFLEANTVTAKMIVAYNRREQGKKYLVKVLAPLLQKFIQMKDLDLDISPARIQNQMITDEEIKTGQKSKMERATNDTQALENPEVRAILKARIDQLLEMCGWFLDAIINTLQDLPYGLRWICRQIVDIANSTFKNVTLIQVQKTIGYFVYYRFFNPAIVSPDIYDVIRLNLNPTQRKNLVQIAKVLQSLFNFSDVITVDYLSPINDFVKSNSAKLSKYLSALVEVAEPADVLGVDEYVELTQGTKPIILMSFDEVYSTHELLTTHLSVLSADAKEPIKIIIDELGKLPEYDLTDDDLEREVQLVLSSRFTEATAQEQLDKKEKIALSIKTRDAVIALMNAIPLDQTSSTIGELMEKSRGDPDPQTQDLLKKIDKYFGRLEEQDKQSRAVICDKIMKDIEDFVASEANRRIQRKNIIKRLRQGLENLFKNQKFMKEQMESFNTYLDVARQQQSVGKKKKKSGKSMKFSYSKLSKMGIIHDSSVPEKSRKACTFTLSASEKPNEFFVKAKMAGITVDTITILLDDLLEKQSQNIATLNLENVTLDVNLMIHLLNKNFLKG